MRKHEITVTIAKDNDGFRGIIKPKWTTSECKTIEEAKEEVKKTIKELSVYKKHILKDKDFKYIIKWEYKLN